jgi:hypothetical protein
MGSLTPPTMTQPLQSVGGPFDDAEHDPMRDDAGRRPYDHRSADDVRSAFDRPSFELGGDALPLTYLEGEVRSPLVVAGSLPAFAAAYDRLRVPAQARTGYWAS